MEAVFNRILAAPDGDRSHLIPARWVDAGDREDSSNPYRSVTDGDVCEDPRGESIRKPRLLKAPCPVGGVDSNERTEWWGFRIGHGRNTPILVPPARGEDQGDRYGDRADGRDRCDRSLGYLGLVDSLHRLPNANPRIARGRESIIGAFRHRLGHDLI